MNRIFKLLDDKEKLLGTGFSIKSNNEGSFILTCGHVANKSNSIFINGKKSEIISNNYRSGLDLAVIFVENLESNPLKLSFSLRPDKVNVIGFTQLNKDVIKREPINDIRTKYDVFFNDVSSISLFPDEEISSGYSGSPVTCSENEVVVGIVCIQQGKEKNYAIESSNIAKIYNVEEENIEFSKPTFKKRKRITLENENEVILRDILEKRVNESLSIFSTQAKIWVDPNIYNVAEFSNHENKYEQSFSVEDIISRNDSIFFFANRQFGLTSLSHYLIKTAFESVDSEIWLYLDGSKIAPYRSSVEAYVKKELKYIDVSIAQIDCIILDGLSGENVKNQPNEVLKLVNEYFSENRLIVMQTKVENPLSAQIIEIPEKRKFLKLYLWSLKKNDIRKLVINYNERVHAFDEELVVEKLISDLDVLNIHRTPFNCFTLLKIFEVGLDDSPVNRTELISKILFLLFNVDEIPSYKNRPDLKDTEYVLGFYCECLVKRDDYFFSKKSFIEDTDKFCKDREIDLDVEVIFDVLNFNNIIVFCGNNLFNFRYSYWVFYFLAHRMHRNEDFSEYILKEMRYVSYPEVIEFYTGIDRNRNNALEILTSDIKKIRDLVSERVKLSDDFNIYDLIKWSVDEEKLESISKEISSDIEKSNLPVEVKDAHADRSYNNLKPKTQNFHKIIEEYSLLKLMKCIEAGSKALRNSDYADPKIRHDLFSEIMIGWSQISKCLSIFSPILLEHGRVNIEGANFILINNKESHQKQHPLSLVTCFPKNVVRWYKDHIFSKKMGTLISNNLIKQKGRLERHHIYLLLVYKRPNGWDSLIYDYVIGLDKNSFYLLDIFESLRSEYRYAFLKMADQKKMEDLIKKSFAKHEGVKNPSSKSIRKTPDSILPLREEV